MSEGDNKDQRTVVALGGDEKAGRKPRPPKATRGILAIGATLNGIYEVKRFLARGGMGEVYEGVNIEMDERVAIKVMLSHLAADPKVQAMFRKEARTLTQLAHPALVQYRVLAREPKLDLYYIVTDYIDGEPLGNVLSQIKPTIAQLAGLTRRLADGLGFAHDHGAIHRDMSPDNVLLPAGRLDRAKIIDFGIAKSLDATAHTVVGDGFAGKLGYVAPEQFGDFGRNIGPWTDIYSLGLVILAVAGGKAPAMGATLVEAVDRRRAGVDLSALPEVLKPLFGQMLQADPANRPSSMRQVIDQLNALDIPPDPIDASAPIAPGWGTLTPSQPPASMPPKPISEVASPPLAAEPHALTTFLPGGLAPEAPAAEAPVVEEPAAEHPLVAEPVAPEIVESVSELKPAAPELKAEAPAAVEAPAETPKPVVAEAPPAAPPPPAPPPPAPKAAAPRPAPKVEPSEPIGKSGGPSKGVMAAIAAVVLAAVVGAGVFLMPKHKAAPAAGPAPAASEEVAAAAPTGIVDASARKVADAVAGAMPTISCSWLNIDRADTASDGAVRIKVSGAAEDPIAVNKAISAAAQGAGATNLKIDTSDVATAGKASCGVLEAVRQFRTSPSAPATLVAQQAKFEMATGLQGCPHGVWAQPMVTAAPTASAKPFTLIAVQPNGTMQQVFSDQKQLASFAQRTPNLFKALGDGRYRISTCQKNAGLVGLLLVEGNEPFDLGLKPGSASRPPADFADRFKKLAQANGWSTQMVWFRLVNEQPDLPETEVAKTDATAVPADATAEPAPAAPAAAASLPADYVACRRYVGGAWEEMGYGGRDACVIKAFANRCDVLNGRSGTVELRRRGTIIEAHDAKVSPTWLKIADSPCAAKK